MFSDLHNRWQIVEYIISTLREERQLKIDQIIFLGDYFDSFGDTPEIATATATWLAQSIMQPDRIHLVGNHDMPYLLLPEAAAGGHHLPMKLRCPGFTIEKHWAIRKIIREEHIARFRGMHYAADFLFSHAGILGSLIPEPSVTKYPNKTIPEAITSYVNDELRELVVESKWFERPFPIFYSGDRMGFANPGGVTWADWHTEFEPTEGLNQIVGHSIVDVATKREAPNSVNYAVDTRSNFVYLVTEGSLEIKSIPLY